MTFESHPKWKYSKTAALIVDDAEAEEALGEGWFDSPAELQAHLDEQARQIDEQLRQSRAERLADKELDDEIKRLQGETEEPKVDIEGLRKIADERGLTYHHKLGADKLEALIKEDIEAKGE